MMFYRISSLAILLCTLGSLGRCDDPGGYDDLPYRQAMATAVRAAAERMTPSVVTVEVIGTAGVVSGEVQQDAPTSGVIIAAEGGTVEILVSNIVLRRPAATILVVLPDGSRHAASPVSQDFHRSLALLRIQTDASVSVAELPSSIKVPVGSTVVAVGRYGLDQSPIISTGIYSADGRLDGIAMQTDARVPPAMYGGPLVDLYGRFLGVLIPAVAAGGAEDITAWYDSGIAFAIPADVIAGKLQRMRSGQDIKKGLIGIVAGSPDPNDSDTSIAAVRVRSPAEAAGIKAGDEVVSLANQPVRRHQQIKQILGSYDAGESLSLVVRRDGQPITLNVTLTDSIPPLQPQRLGIVAGNVNQGDVSKGDGDNDDVDDTDADSDLDNGDLGKRGTRVVVKHVLPASPADAVLEVGDEITRIGQIDVTNQQLLRRQLIVAEPGQKLAVTVVRDGETLTETIPVQSISGRISNIYPAGWTKKRQADGESDADGSQPADAKTSPWSVRSIQLPDAANTAAILAPQSARSGAASGGSLGMLVLLMEPGKKDPQKFLQAWKDNAVDSGVVVVAVASEDPTRWQAKEIRVISGLAATAQKQAAVNPMAVAVASASAVSSQKATAADSMAFAVAISQSETFFGVAVARDVRPPAVRLRENEPSSSLRILMPVSDADEPPGWTEVIKSSGYPIVIADRLDQSTLLRWCRLLQAI